MANRQTTQAVAPGREQEPALKSGEQPRGRQDVYRRQQIGRRDKKGQQLAQALAWLSIGLGLAEVIAPRRLARLIGLNGDHTVLIRAMGLREITSGIGILAQPGTAGWVWSRVAGDALDISLLGSALASEDSDRGRLAAATAAVAGVTALDYYCAQQLGRGESARVSHVKAITVNRPVEEVYRFWRDFRNLPRFMSHLESVEVIDERRSHWVAKAPAGATVEWDAEIIEDRPNELIAWRSLEGADVENSGSVRFRRAPGERGTEIRVEMEYTPPGGIIGATVAKLFGREPGQQIKGDIYRFKQVLETGEVVHSDASIHRGMHPAQPQASRTEL
ncbi:MAG TPA: SRPBCC family protein [Blastocatellia bacterium]|nr:SRPBCC family protein [Blastocatellia bacterium]